MPYLDHNHSHKRLAGVTGVALVHIALALGLTVGLAITYEKDDTVREFVGDQIPIPPPLPTDTPTPTEDTVIVDRTAPPLPPMPLPTSAASPVPPGEGDLPLDPPLTGGGTVIQLPPNPPPSPQPVYTPRPPVPANGPAGWVTTDDYPRTALLRGWEGTVAYQVDVGTDGRVQACRIASSSGHDVLDQAACTRIQRRARFRAATDRSGAEVAGTYRGSVSWEIPD